MSEELQKEKSNNEEKKKTRRTRKDEQGRNFICPCGKSYLSYPALYTHTKTKHQGKAPKDDGSNTVVKEPAQEQNENRDPVAQMKETIDKYLAGNSMAAYPTPLAREDNQYVEKVIEDWQLVKESKIDDPSNNLTESIDNIFGRFLSEMKPQVKAEGYLYLCELVCALHKSICEQNKDKEFCKTGNGTSLCYFFNTFITKKNELISITKGSPINNSFLTCKVLQNLGIWIFEQRYTNSLVKFANFWN